MTMTCPHCQADLTELEVPAGKRLTCPECKSPVPNPASTESESTRPPSDQTPPELPSTEDVVVSPDGVYSGSEPDEAAREPDDAEEDKVHNAPTAVPGDELTPGADPATDAPPAEAPEPDRLDEEVRKEFGEYEILSELGRGAMGIVYRARHRFLKRQVAIKVMLAGVYASKKQVARFYREAQAAARLRHPSIVPIYDIGKRHGRHFFTMDYVEGRSLSGMVQSGDVTIRSALKLVIELADALGYAHDQKVIHRDIKPSNIIVDMEGRPHIMDFGLAKQLDSGTKFTQTGSAIGTPAYMSPEQAAGESHRLDHRTDIYSLGAVLYELVTAEPPFDGENMMKVIMKVLNHEPALPRTLNPRIHRDIQTIILKAMEKNPERRYQTMREFADDLRRFMAGEAILARPASPLYRTWRKARKNTLAIVSVSLACIIAGLSSVYVFVAKEQLAKAEKHTNLIREELNKVEAERAEEIKPKEVQAVADDFNEPTLSEKWKPQGSPPAPDAWRVENGELAAKASHEEVLMLEPSPPLVGNVRFEYRVRVDERAEGYRLDCLIGADHNQAFRVILESDEPKPHLVLQRSGVKLAEVDISLFEKGRPYDCLLERRADQIRYEVRTDGQLVGSLRYRDRDIIRDLGLPDGAFKLGFAVWDTQAWFDRVQVTSESAPAKSPPLYDPQRLMLMKQYDVAITLLNGIMHDESKSDFEKAQACYLVGRCQELKGDFDKALESYEAVPTTFGTPAAKGAETEENPAKFLAENELRKFFCFFRTGRLTQAAAALSRLTETGALIDGASVWHFRDALQRCLVTPRLDEALAILRNARFASLDSAPGPEEKGLTLFLISQATSKSLYNDFLEKAVRLAARFGQGTHTSFTQIAEVYKAFPDPAMSPAIRQGLRQATRMGKLDEALTLLKFARESLPKTEDLDAEAEDIGKRFCELQQFQRVQDVYTSHPSAKLLVCFQRAVDGLLKQGERDAAKTLYSKATDIAKKQEVMSETAYESLDKMAANLMDAYTRTGSYPQLIEILSAPGRSSLTLVAPVEAALARTIENGEFDQAIEILRVFRQRSLPPTETLLRQIQRLADTLAEKQMVQAFKSAYNAYPVEKLADSLVRLMTSCHDKEGYASCVELLKFAKDKLDAGHFKEAGPKFEEFLVRFAAVANSRRKFQEIIAAHRAFPSDKLLPQFVQAIDLSLRPAETGAEATPPPDYPFLVNLFPYARQSWPFPQATELHQRLLKFARGLLAVAHGATPQPETPKKPDDAPRPAEEKALAPKVLETLLKSFRDAIEDSKEKGKAYYGLSVDYADLLLVANRFQEAGKHLDELAPNLPRQHDLRDDVLLRLAAIVSDSGERTTAIALWKILSEENGPEGPYARLFEFMTGEPKESAFQGWKDPALQAFLTAQRAQLQGGDRAVLRTAIEQVVQLCKDQPTWYLAIAESRLRKLEKAEPAPKPAEETRKEGKEGAKEGKAPDSPGAP